MKQLQGKLTITRRGGGDLGVAHLEILDQSSGCPAVEVQLPLARFAEALLGLGRVPCELAFNDSSVVGKAHEHKQQKVWVPALPHGKQAEAERKRLVAEALAPFEVDGWQGCPADAVNPHNWVREQTGRQGGWYVWVTFHRYV